jgi:hypothetical protein
MTYEAARAERRHRSRKISSTRAIPYEAAAPGMGESLLAHMRRTSKANQGISPWLAVAVLAGAIVALAFVNFLAR